MKLYKNIKYTIDKLIVIILSPIILLFLLLCSLFLLIFQGRPVFYTSERLGSNLRTFKIYKFRTMKNNSVDLRNPDGTTFNSSKDSRVTKIGSFFRKFSLDEIPQVINVIKGEMSLIGPRPDLPDQLNIYTSNNLSLDRFKVRPGISGYAQVNGRNSLSIFERNQLDNYYVNNLTIKLDFYILFKTIIKVVFSKNINKNESK